MFRHPHAAIFLVCLHWLSLAHVNAGCSCAATAVGPEYDVCEGDIVERRYEQSGEGDGRQVFGLRKGCLMREPLAHAGMNVGVCRAACAGLKAGRLLIRRLNLFAGP